MANSQSFIQHPNLTLRRTRRHEASLPVSAAQDCHKPVLKKNTEQEQSSYSAMLNIAESIPPPESIPPIPELHPTQFHSIPESLLLIPRNSAEFRPIPESLELIPIPESLTDIHPHPHICYMREIPLCDSGTGIERN